MSLPKIVAPEEWLAARKELLAKEKDLTRRRDALNIERRNLPMVEIEKDYVFEGPDGKVSVAIVNRRLRPELGGLGVFLRYDHQQLPDYIAWRMMREGLYAMGMEPATNPFGNPTELIGRGYPIMLEPGETRIYELEFGVLIGKSAIDAFAASRPVQ